jgi:hypothetical protein
VSSHCQWADEQLGMQFLGAIIGSVIGEQMGGVLSDFWMNRRSRWGISTVARMLPKRKTIAYAHAGRRIEGCRAIVSPLADQSKDQRRPIHLVSVLRP